MKQNGKVNNNTKKTTKKATTADNYQNYISTFVKPISTLNYFLQQTAAKVTLSRKIESESYFKLTANNNKRKRK